MKKSLIYILAIAVVSLTSCLKDKPNTDFSSIGTVIELPYAGLQYFSRDAVTDAPDADGKIAKAFGINIASAKPLSTDTKYTIAVDNALLTAYNATPGVPVIYDVMPTDAYTIDKLAGTIKAGQRLDSVHIVFDKTKLDPSKSYLLPIKLVSATNGVVSGNFNAHYYHFIGNDFAGTYEHYYTRWESPDTTAGAPSSNKADHGSVVISPVSPNEVTVNTDYYTAPRYDITFTKTGVGPSATYSNFQVKFVPDDISGGLWAQNITVTNAPAFQPADFKTNPYDPNKQYTYAEALKLFRIYFTTATRAIRDEYVKQ